VAISPGDFVIADDDGVVVWPAAEVAELLVAAEDKARRDRDAAERVDAGGGLDGPV
jgi:4-hydroxy-4-methyl-2-oxoglutarate aldolase